MAEEYKHNKWHKMMRKEGVQSMNVKRKRDMYGKNIGKKLKVKEASKSIW